MRSKPSHRDRLLRWSRSWIRVRVTVWDGWKGGREEAGEETEEEIIVGRIGTETLTNKAGEVTSHLQGMFNRTIRLLEAGIKPVYVFDGQPPDLKKQELAKRYSKREDASKELTAAIEAPGEAEAECAALCICCCIRRYGFTNLWSPKISSSFNGSKLKKNPCYGIRSFEGAGGAKSHHGSIY
ncbi:flap endonuclease 1-like [Dioscorea cayenensis subsp. rotundata]|uniref:Flap endonuclease 1-like n=1 Tax=Dioscorea cayennensis subsp. rotundata TaxID=55577 RepID=A0AB40D3A7_DIOCR|nr:flap endonuclease 1-like [Dioscorea cayenensis subsp. rotundata]